MDNREIVIQLCSANRACQKWISTMHLSWEASHSVDYHGFLKSADFQKDGIDLHATFLRSGGEPHISIYYGGDKKTQIQMKKKAWGGGLEISAKDRKTLLTVLSGLKENDLETFLSRIDKMYQSLTNQKTVPVKKVETSFASAIGGTSASWAGGKKSVHDTISFPALGPKN